MFPAFMITKKVKPFAGIFKILKPGSKKFSRHTSQNAIDLCFTSRFQTVTVVSEMFFFCESTREVMQQTHILIDRNY